MLQYFATSRALYSRLRKDFQLPSISTLTKITSKVKNIDEQKFLLRVFKNLPHHQKQCIVIWNEMYIKSALTYHGGTIFGKSIDCPEKLAKTMLGRDDQMFVWRSRIYLQGIPHEQLNRSVFAQRSR